ncbi:PTPB [Mytilus edulis]|uniref:protein-tyrosine-phosphatase n=1 Tax=Mytilus edulis TaxID=6550 RepID=A0A8S3Q5G3_MYTED|nr:PTPB [Mytilus edulis]
MVDTESQSMKKSTEISTVKSTYDKTQTSSDKTSVDEKAQSVNSPGLEQDLSTNDITSETLTSELKINLRTATMMSHLNTKSLTEAAITTTNQSEQEDKITTETETDKTIISRNETKTTLESVTITEAAGKTTNRSKQEHKASTETKTEKTTISRKGSSSPSVDMTGTRISTETTPETTVEPVTINESVVKTTKQYEQEHSMTTETKTDKTTISRNGSSSSSVDMTRTRILTETTPELVTITETAAVKTTKQYEQEHMSSTEINTDKTTTSRNGSRSSSVDMTRTRISTGSTPESVTITEAGDNADTNSIGKGMLTTAPSVKVSMTTLSAKSSYETSTTSQQLQTTTGSAFISMTWGTGNQLQQLSTQTSGEPIRKAITTSNNFTTEDGTLTRNFEIKNTTESFNMEGNIPVINVTHSSDLKINSVNSSKSELSPSDLSSNVLTTSSFTVLENKLSSVNAEYSSDLIDSSVNSTQIHIFSNRISDDLNPSVSPKTDIMQESTSSSVTVGDSLKTGTPSERTFFNTTIEKENDKSSIVDLSSGVSMVTPLYNSISNESSVTTAYVDADIDTSNAVSTDNVMSDKLSSTKNVNSHDKKKNSSFTTTFDTTMYTTVLNSSGTTTTGVRFSDDNNGTNNMITSDKEGSYDIESVESSTSNDNTVVPIHTLSTSLDTKVNYPTLDSVTEASSTSERVFTSILTAREEAQWETTTTTDFGPATDKPSNLFTQSQRLSSQSPVFVTSVIDSSSVIATLSPEPITKTSRKSRNLITTGNTKTSEMLNKSTSQYNVGSQELSTVTEYNPSKGSSQDLSVAEERSTVSEDNTSKGSSQDLSVAEERSTISEDNTSKGSSQDLSVAEERSTVTEVNPSKKSSQGLSVTEERITVTEDNPSKESAQGLSVTQERSTVTEYISNKESTESFPVSEKLSTVSEVNPSKESSQGLSVTQELSTVTEENTSKGLSQGLTVTGELSTVSEVNPNKGSSQGLSETGELSTVSDVNPSKESSQSLPATQELSTDTEDNPSKGSSQGLSVTREISIVSKVNPSKESSQVLSVTEELSTVTEDNPSEGSSQGLSVKEEVSTVSEVNPSKESSQGLSVTEELSTVSDDNSSQGSSQSLSVTEELHTVTKENTSKGLYLGLILSGEPSTVSEHNPSKQSSQGSIVTKELNTATGDISRESSNPYFTASDESTVSHHKTIEMTSPVLSSTVRIEQSSVISDKPPSLAYIENITTKDTSSDLTTPSSSTVWIDADNALSKNVPDEMTNILPSPSPNSLPSEDITEDISKYVSSSASVVKDITHEMTTQSFIQQNSENTDTSTVSSSSATQTKTTYKSEKYETSTGQTTQIGSLQNTTIIATKQPITTVPPTIEGTSQLYGTTTYSIITGLFFNVTITERKLNVIKLQVRVSSTRGEKFTILKWLYKTLENSTRTEVKALKEGHYINEFIKEKGLEIGFCYNFQIDVQTQNGRWIGPIDQRACTKPRAPGSGTHTGNSTITSIPLVIQHPNEEHFDSFRIDYENNAKKLSMTVNRDFDGSETKTEISGLVPESCYNIDVYTVSFSEISHNSRSFTNVCTRTPVDPNSYTVIYGESSFTIFWVNFSDKYHVNVSCNYLSQVFSVNKPSLYVNGTIPGDCCVLNVKNWNYTVSRQYFVHVNETLPEYPVVISNVTTRTHLNLTWIEPMRSNGWIHGYTVNLFDSKDTTIENYTVSCIQPEPKCSRNDSYWKLQKYPCSSISLINNRNANIYYNNSQFHLSIGGFKPGMLYQYSITVTNKAGSNTTDRIPVITQEDKPESPASLGITVPNVTTMSITWSPPNVTNGVITGYNVSYCSNGISGCKYTVVEGMTSVILRNLDCWKEYLVCVSALTSAGAGSKMCGVKNTSVYEPQSKISKATASNTTIRLELEVPCDSVGTPISYDVSCTSLDHSCTGNQTNVTNWIECFPWSSFPQEVRNVRAENIKSDSLRVCWEKPCFLNSDTVFYNVTLDDYPYGNIKRSGTIPLTECEEIADLLPYTNYTISVTAINQNGKADPVGIIKQTDIAVPHQPRFSHIEEHATMMIVEWKPPNPYTGPTNYTVTVRDIENSETKDCKTSVYNQTRCSVDGLEEYWQYEVTITAHTERGYTQYKHPHYIKTKQSAPGPVTHLRVNHEKDPEKPRLVFITFSPPVYRERNGVIKAYYVKCHDTRTYRDIQVVKLTNNLTELKMIVPDQVLLNISVFAETVANGTEVYQTVIVPAGAKDLPIGGALAGVFLAIILFIIIAIVVILYRKQMICFKPQPKVIEKVNLTGIKQNKKVSVDHEDTRKSRPVKIDKFYQHVELLARDSDHFFSKEYKELKAMAPMHPTEAAVQQEARTKNRYSNILPFDHSRVKLLPLDDEDGSDYINANYIPGFNSKREYIATQGPLPATKDDFWRMIWEQNVSVIVMLTQCVERGKRKCECYWPECVKEPVYYGDLSIEIENESHLPEYVLRTITVTLGNIQKRIMHFLYLAWPDMGVPSSTDNMISLVKTVRSHINPTMKGPMTVHCSAGVGRTGTFINVDVLLHQLDNDYNQIDIFGEVLKLRNHRCNMVQTEDQYKTQMREEAVDGGDEPMYQNVPSKK